MDAVNELSCEFAATVFTRMRNDKQIEPQVALAVIRNFYAALRPLMLESDRSIENKLTGSKTFKVGESASGGH